MAELRTTPVAPAGIFSWKAHAQMHRGVGSVQRIPVDAGGPGLAVVVGAGVVEVVAGYRQAGMPALPYTRSVSPTPNRPRCGASACRPRCGPGKACWTLLEPSIPRSLRRLPRSGRPAARTGGVPRWRRPTSTPPRCPRSHLPLPSRGYRSGLRRPAAPSGSRYRRYCGHSLRIRRCWMRRRTGVRADGTPRRHRHC